MILDFNWASFLGSTTVLHSMIVVRALVGLVGGVKVVSISKCGNTLLIALICVFRWFQKTSTLSEVALIVVCVSVLGILLIVVWLVLVLLVHES